MKMQDFVEQQTKSHFKRLYILTELFMGKTKYCRDCNVEKGHSLTSDIKKSDVFVSKKQALFYLEECGHLSKKMAVVEVFDSLPAKIRISDAGMGYGLSLADIEKFAKEEGNV